MAKPAQLLSAAFMEFVQHLDADERQRAIEARAKSPQENRPSF